jgi:hypothetical protein
MAIRTTPEDVRTIIDTDETNLMPFIRAANIVVETILASDSSLTAEQLQEIELWLAAHFVAIKDPVTKSESIGEASVTYFIGNEGEGLKMTPYGQAACSLDTSGRLTNLSKRRAEFKAIDLGL